jgi:hypothetical protein
MKKLRNIAGDGLGAEIAEFAVVLPLLFAMIFAIFSFGRAYYIYSTITRAAQDAARVAATPGCASCGGSACSWTPFPCDTTVTDTVANVLNVSRIDVTQITTLAPTPSAQSCTPPAPAPNCVTATNQITICRYVVLNPNTTPQECGVIVSFQYPYQLLPMLNPRTINIPAQAQVRMEY